MSSAITSIRSPHEHPVIAWIAIIAIVAAILLIAWARLEIHGTDDLEAALAEPRRATCRSRRSRPQARRGTRARRRRHLEPFRDRVLPLGIISRGCESFLALADARILAAAARQPPSIAALPYPAFLAQAQPRKPAQQPDVIFVPTPHEVVDDMLRLANVGKGDILYDLGSGDGRIAIAAAKKFGIRAVGIDIDPERIREANENARKAGVTHLVEFRQEDLFKADFREATVVTLYLLPDLNVKLRPRLWTSSSRARASSRTSSTWAPGSPRSGSSRTAAWSISGRFPRRRNR